jgi:hypothetical protein
MKKQILLGTFSLLALSLSAAESEPKQAVESAAKELAAKPNYTWTTSIEWGGQNAGTIQGKAQKGGATTLTLSRGDTSMEAVLKDGKGALKTDEGWKSLPEITGENAPGGTARMVGRILQRFQAPPIEAADLLAKMKSVKLADGVYSGDLTEDGAKSLMLSGGRSGSGGPQVSDAKGSVRFWLKEGLFSKYEFSLDGKVTINGEERDAVRKHTIEIKDVGTTKVSVPEEAAKKL